MYATNWTRRADGHFLELLVPRENTTLMRVFTITHLDDFLTIHTHRDGAGRPRPFLGDADIPMDESA